MNYVLGFPIALYLVFTGYALLFCSVSVNILADRLKADGKLNDVDYASVKKAIDQARKGVMLSLATMVIGPPIMFALSLITGMVIGYIK